MAVEDNTIVGLRDQILENWRYLHPHRSPGVILVARKEECYEAILAEDRAQGSRIFLASSNDHDNIVEALEELLDLTAQMISEFLRPRSYGGGRFYAI